MFHLIKPPSTDASLLPQHSFPISHQSHYYCPLNYPHPFFLVSMLSGLHSTTTPRWWTGCLFYTSCRSCTLMESDQCFCPYICEKKCKLVTEKGQANREVIWYRTLSRIRDPSPSHYLATTSLLDEICETAKPWRLKQN